MNFENYKSAFKIKTSRRTRYSDDYIERCLNYAQILLNNNVPVIYNLTHFSLLVGYNKEYIIKSCFCAYRNFVIKKKNGKFRLISEPFLSLKQIQYWILVNILQNISISRYAKAYQKEINLVENIKFHTNQPKVLTIDLKDFFPSIKTSDIERIFFSLGYSELISNLMAKLCTKDGKLPQGAPTSPYLSNIFFKPIDEMIAKYCLAHKIRYTRYADDLTFSGDFDDKQLLNFVKTTIENNGFTINNDKTKLMKPNTQQTVTGIIVNEKPQVAFKKRNQLRQDLFYIKKFGLADHIKHKKIKQANYLEHIIGQINFILQINPEDTEFQSYKRHLIELKKNCLDIRIN